MKNAPNDTSQSHSILADEAAISTLTARFADAVNRRDRALFQSLWLPEGGWQIKPPMNLQVQGIDQILTMFDQLLEQWEFFVQMVHSGTLEISRDRAITRWYIQEIGRSNAGKGFQNFGFYVDKLVYQNETWLFAQRTYHFIYIDEPTLTGQAFPLEELNGYP